MNAHIWTHRGTQFPHIHPKESILHKIMVTVISILILLALFVFL